MYIFILYNIYFKYSRVQTLKTFARYVFKFTYFNYLCHSFGSKFYIAIFISMLR